MSNFSYIFIKNVFSCLFDNVTYYVCNNMNGDKYFNYLLVINIFKNIIHDKRIFH